MNINETYFKAVVAFAEPDVESETLRAIQPKTTLEKVAEFVLYFFGYKAQVNFDTVALNLNRQFGESKGAGTDFFLGKDIQVLETFNCGLKNILKKGVRTELITDIQKSLKDILKANQLRKVNQGERPPVAGQASTSTQRSILAAVASKKPQPAPSSVTTSTAAGKMKKDSANETLQASQGGSPSPSSVAENQSPMQGTDQKKPGSKITNDQVLAEAVDSGKGSGIANQGNLISGIMASKIQGNAKFQALRKANNG